MEGVIIYNKNTQSPYYYNGKQWLSLGGRLPRNMSTTTDRITYTIAGGGFPSTEREIYSSSHMITNASRPTPGAPVGKANFSNFQFNKPFDFNSVAINQATVLGSVYQAIEFK